MNDTTSITKESIAAALNGTEYGHNCSFDKRLNELSSQAEEAGLLIVYGASDDLMEFEGAFREEVGAYGGTIAHLDRKGVLDRDRCDTDDEIADFTIRKRTSRPIEAVWGKDDISWQFHTEIPHVTFDVMEDGEVFCRGLVIDTVDLPEPAEP